MKQRLMLWFLLSYVLGVLFLFSIDRRYDSLGGDDVFLYRMQVEGEQSSSFKQCMTEHGAEKWRPVTSLLNYATYTAFHDDARSYIFINIGVHAASAALIGLCSTMLLRRKESSPWLVPTLYVAAYSILGFTYYHLTQRFGLMEELCVLLTVATLFLMIGEGRQVLRSLCILTIFTLAILTHERFMALGVLVSFYLFTAHNQNKVLRLLAACVPWLILAAYLIVKSQVLNLALLVGTGGQTVQLGFSSLFGHLYSVVFNLLGYNNGHVNLATYESSNSIWWVAVLFLIVFGGTLALLIGKLLKDSAGRPTLLLLVCLLPMLSTAVVCHRIEFRWIAVPWVVFALSLLAIWRLLQETSANRVLKSVFISCLACWFCLSAWQSISIRRNIENVYFFYWLKDAESLRGIFSRTLAGTEKVINVYFTVGCEEILQWAYIDKKRFHIFTGEEVDATSMDVINEVICISRSPNGWSISPRNYADEVQNVGFTNVVTKVDLLTIPGLAPALRNATEDMAHRGSHLLRAGQLYRNRDDAKSEFFTKAAIECAAPSDPYPYAELGQLYYSQGKFKESLQAYKKAFENDNPANRNPGFLITIQSLEDKLK